MRNRVSNQLSNYDGVQTGPHPAGHGPRLRSIRTQGHPGGPASHRRGNGPKSNTRQPGGGHNRSTRTSPANCGPLAAGSQTHVDVSGLPGFTKLVIDGLLTILLTNRFDPCRSSQYSGGRWPRIGRTFQAV